MDCWEVIVDRWCSDAWLDIHNNAKDRRAQMVGVPHHQGSRNLAGYGQKWVCGLLFFFHSISSLCQFDPFPNIVLCFVF
jgi:hypothetical protein